MAGKRRIIAWVTEAGVTEAVYAQPAPEEAGSEAVMTWDHGGHCAVVHWLGREVWRSVGTDGGGEEAFWAALDEAREIAMALNRPGPERERAMVRLGLRPRPEAP